MGGDRVYLFLSLFVVSDVAEQTLLTANHLWQKSLRFDEVVFSLRVPGPRPITELRSLNEFKGAL